MNWLPCILPLTRVSGVLPEFSAGLLHSLRRLEESEALARYIPQRYLHAYSELKRSEYADLIEPILPGEIDFYL